jgi:hypothetical protein
VRSDASDVVRFVGIIDDIGAQAVRTQRAKADLGKQLKDVADLRDQVESDAFGLLSPEDSETLAARLRAFEAKSGERIVEPPAAEPVREEPAPGVDQRPSLASVEQRSPLAAVDEAHAAIDTRLQAVQRRLKEQSRALDVREDAIVERADRLQTAVGARDGGSAARLALATAQRIAAEGSRAITAQTARLEPKDVGALANG